MGCSLGIAPEELPLCFGCSDVCHLGSGAVVESFCRAGRWCRSDYNGYLLSRAVAHLRSCHTIRSGTSGEATEVLAIPVICLKNNTEAFLTNEHTDMIIDGKSCEDSRYDEVRECCIICHKL